STSPPPLARSRTWSIGKPEPQSQWPPPHAPRSACWQTPRPDPCAWDAVSFVIGMPNAAASSAIHFAQLSSMAGWRFHSSRDQLANAHSSVCTATGLAFAAVHALLPRLTYSPITPALSSMPVCDDTPLEVDAKKLPSSSIVVAPSAVWTTISRTVAPPRLE